MKQKLRKLPYQKLYHFYRTALVILGCFAILGLIIYIIGRPSHYILLLLSLIISITVIGLLVILLKLLNAVLREILVIDIDIDKYRNYFDYAYRKSNKGQRQFAMIESYVADGQYHYLKGDFKQSLESFSRVQGQKIIWYRRKTLVSAVAYYTLLNHIHQKDFTSYEEDLKRFQVLKGKNIAERAQKISAIHDVMTGMATSYFNQTVFEHKLDKIEAIYYEGLNSLNQGDRAKAEGLFQSIVSENPDLFYVQEAKKYLKSSGKKSR
ncbi:hypothetical protein AB3329_11615 [Streptococcus sp. H31]|uniref:hypothetical protein n=1 Tax=Streptococcus huangxiaojuni TaxID=3237239 RepID=UPI0034A458BA